jgi:hypothetical protein
MARPSSTSHCTWSATSRGPSWADHAQAAFLDPPANAAGAAVTAGLALRVGGR